MLQLSSADHSTSPPTFHIPRVYNAAHDLLERNLRADRADKVVYYDVSGSHTYGELAERVNRFADALVSLGLDREQRILLCLLDTMDFPVAFLGAIKAGVVPVATNTMLTTADFEHMLNDSRACALVVSARLLPMFDPLVHRLPHLKYVIVSDGDGKQHPALGHPSVEHHSFAKLLEDASPQFETAPTCADDMCFWLYSSGSTGPPKGTVHVQSSMIQTAELYARAILGLHEADVIFSASKLPFAYGLGNSLSFPLAVGASAVLMAERPTPAAIFEHLHRYQPTVLCAVPTAFAAMLANPALPRCGELRLRLCTSAGEALPEDLGRRWSKHFAVDILDGIGSTEMLHVFLTNHPGEVCYGTTGRPVPGYEVRIVGEDGLAVKQGETGELLVSGPTSAIFYWNNRIRSRSTFQGLWTRTGDKYQQRADGCFVYEGRADDMIKVSGLYVSPIEVESALVAHEAVLEAAVIGTEDEARLIKPLAFVVLRPGHSASASLAEELKQHVKSRLAHYKYPRWIEFIDELPKTATGKIQRFKLRSMRSSR